MQQFSQGGYVRHIRLTTDPLCHQIYNNQLADIPESDLPDYPVVNSSPANRPWLDEVASERGPDLADLDNCLDMDLDNIGSDGSCVDKEEVEIDVDDAGDEIGDIEDMEWHADYAGDSGTESDVEDDLEEAAELYELEYQWEAEIDDTIIFPQSPSSQHDQPELSSSIAPISLANCILGKLGMDSDVTVKSFPSECAGAPLHDSHDKHAFEHYQTQVNNDSGPYAPFTSKLDWEFAHWAKIQGPGSTAVSDLLKIEGVCSHLLF
jgi:hypothetical protein